MSDEATQESQTPAELNRYVKQVEKENKALKAQLLGSHLKGIGLDPERGLGKAVARDYQGDFSAASVVEFAKDEYDHVYEPPNPEEQEEASPPQEALQPTPAETEEAKLAELNGQSESSTPPPATDEVKDAESKLAGNPDVSRKDAESSTALKVAQYLNR